MENKNRKKTYRTKQRQDQSKTKGFFAYPRQPEDRLEIIEKAITIINKQSDLLKLSSLRNIEKGSSRIISNILTSIDNADFFIGDISGLNPNVLFEAGYAFGRRKRTILISQGCSTKDFQQDISDLQILSGWEIVKYENVSQLASAILAIDFIGTKYVAEFDKYLNLCDQQVGLQRGLFLKASCKHEIAVSALNTFKTMLDDVLVDDWDENRSQTLNWYIKAICQSTTVLSLFIPIEWDNSRSMNARFSFVCGMALALSKHVRLIGLPGYMTPVDYQGMMMRPVNHDQIRTFLKSDLEVICNQESSSGKPSVNTISENNLNKDTKEIIFLNINLGDSIAENEEHELNKYFINTGQYAEAIKRRQAIVVGNKGTGKTAMFYQLRSYFQNDIRNLVCEIKPSDYKMTRFLQTLSGLQEGRADHVLESIWKLVIYCEIILSQYRKLEKRLVVAGFSQKEEVLIQFYQDHEKLIIAPFEQKLEIATDWLQEVSLDSDNFSKKIHDSFLIACKDILTEVMRGVNKTVILVDNLDKSWRLDANLNQQAQLVLALLGIHRRVSGDLGKESNVSIMIFLRRNIFEYILESKIVREPDKIIADHIELQWNDPEMLLRVVERRFRRALEDQGIDDSQNADIWKEFFDEDVNGMETRKWVYSRVLSRPRDLIHFVQKAIENAINRDHEKIFEADLISAAKSYPEFALEQIISEYKAEQPWLQTAVFSFMGKPDKWELTPLISHLENFLRNNFALNDRSVKSVVADLIGIGFIGIQVLDEKIEYAETVPRSRALKRMVLDHPTGQILNLVIHPVFYLYLNILKQEIVEPNVVPQKVNLSVIEDADNQRRNVQQEIVLEGGNKNTFLKHVKMLWKDPVWSKIIATGILAVLGALGALFNVPISGFMKNILLKL